MDARENEIMAMSLPNNLNVRLNGGSQDDLDRGLKMLEDRLGKIAPYPPRRSGKSLLPKPDYKARASLNSSSALSSSTTSLFQPSSTTSSMLKSTLTRMTKLSSRPSLPPSKSVDETNTHERIKKRCSVPSARSVSRSKSLREPNNTNRLVPANNNNNNNASLKRPARKDETGSLRRSGTSAGPLTKRSQSVKRFRDKDALIRKSRGVQTQLTKDAASDNEEENVDTSPNFNVYLPDLLGTGAVTDPVETHVTEHTEPVDVRKNRQLLLENMKNTREIERLKSQVGENDLLKKELKSVRKKLEEEQRARVDIEKQLDEHNARVRMIVKSMDTVEKEFETRSGEASQLESKCASVQSRLDEANSTIAEARNELRRKAEEYKSLLSRYEEAEAESSELHEFLQAEKSTLSEALKECEGEITEMQKIVREKENERKRAEERCQHLVRSGEQRHQEALTLEARLKSLQERTKSVILCQGAEVSRASVAFDQLSNILESVFNGSIEKPSDVHHHDDDDGDSVLSSSSSSDRASSENEQRPDVSSRDAPATSDESNPVSIRNLSEAIELRKRSQESYADKDFADSSSLSALVDRIVVIADFIDKRNSINCHCGTKQITKDEDCIYNNETLSNGNENARNDYSTQDFNRMLSEKDEEISELKKKTARIVKHRSILQSNWDQSEAEVRQIENFYRDTVTNVLNVFKSHPQLIDSNQDFARLKKILEASTTDFSSPKTDQSNKEFLK